MIKTSNLFKPIVEQLRQYLLGVVPLRRRQKLANPTRF